MDPDADRKLLARVEACLRQAAAALDGVAAALARARPELQQTQGYPLAQLHAQLFAARELAVYGARGPLECQLACAFGGLTLDRLRERLPALGAAVPGCGPEPGAFAAAPETLAVVTLAGAPEQRTRLAAALEARPEGGAESLGADSLGEEHRLLRGSFRAFAERKVRPVAERLHRADALIPDDLLREAGELGCFGLSIPLAFGGVQERPDTLGMVVVTEELCRASLAFGSVITRPEILARALLKGGTDAQRRRFLPPMASGALLVAISVTEPDHGSDVGAITCAARPDGDGWRISGAKTWCTFGGRAELIGLLARSEPDPALGRKGLSLFVVEKPPFHGHDFEHAHPRGGRLTGRAIATLGYRGMHSYELRFEDYFVPGDNLVGGAAGRGRGFYLQMEGFAFGRLQTAARAVGLMQAAYEAARGYARARTVFGKPLADHPLTREKLGAMAATVQACRQATYAAARRLDAPAAGGPGAAGRDGQLEASLVKLLACRQAERVTREAQQLHGGMGYAEEFPVSRYFVDARVLSIFEGTEEVLALRVILPALLKSAG